MAVEKKEPAAIEVEALELGFYGGKLREEGKKFKLQPKETQELTDKQFSQKWMKKV